MPKNSWNGTPPSFGRFTELRPKNVGNGAAMPFGPPVRDSQLLQEQADDFTEAQGHDRQVVTVQAQHRETEDATGKAGRDRRQRQHVQKPRPRY